MTSIPLYLIYIGICICTCRICDKYQNVIYRLRSKKRDVYQGCRIFCCGIVAQLGLDVKCQHYYDFIHIWASSDDLVFGNTRICCQADDLLG